MFNNKKEILWLKKIKRIENSKQPQELKIVNVIRPRQVGTDKPQESINKEAIGDLQDCPLMLKLKLRMILEIQVPNLKFFDYCRNIDSFYIGGNHQAPIAIDGSQAEGLGINYDLLETKLIDVETLLINKKKVNISNARAYAITSARIHPILSLYGIIFWPFWRLSSAGRSYYSCEKARKRFERARKRFEKIEKRSVI